MRPVVCASGSIFLCVHCYTNCKAVAQNFPHIAAIAQLGERQTEDLKVPGSIPGLGIYFACAAEPLQIHSATALHIAFGKDTLAEWLRRRPAKPMGSPRVGSNPTGVVFRIL